MNHEAPTALHAELKFLADRSAPLVYVPSKGGGDETEHRGNFHTRRVEIRDARRTLGSTDLDREGFMLVGHDSTVEDFYDDDALRGIYHAELESLITAITGAHRVVVFDDTRRSSSRQRQRDHGIREPAGIVHNDYTTRSGHRRLADHFADSPDELEELRHQHFAIINAWRSIGPPVVDRPLVMCDARTVDDAHLVAVERRGEERIGELQVALHHPAQRWYYYPRMHRGEVLLFKTFDSAKDGRTRFTLHSAFDNPLAPQGVAPRESLETRCLVFFED